MPGFPMYSLPIVALRELFLQLSLPEIFNISLCSKRSQRNVELLMRRGNSLEVQLDATEASKISVQRKNEYFHLKVAEFSDLIEKPEATALVNLNGSSVTVSIIGQTLFVTDKKSALKNVTKHVLNIFRCQIGKANIGDSCSSYVPTWVIEQQDPINTLSIDARNPSVNDLSLLFTKAKVSAKLTCSFEYSSQGPRPAIKMGKISLQRFDNDSSSWMTAEHLLNLNFEIGLLSESSFKNRDMNRFLKHWMAGGCNRLQEVCIEMQGFIKYSEVLRGVDHELISADEVNEYYSKLYEDTMEIRGGFQVCRRSDGKVARLLDNGASSYFFSFVVFE
ncbi:hypothetical protein CAEBREN_01472 [Caenorhabditis brenneri]|uniref:F-box domain-containing protein n=1 Tax=Caenorhabditis brenneri TaxID=135651 RepID=G0NZM8_CAEBE|nr:hypothetical protein CAEBREN_01472 [Caenorhabditis brenneri]